MTLMPFLLLTPVHFVFFRYRREFETTMHGGLLDLMAFGWGTYIAVCGPLATAMLLVAFTLGRLESEVIWLIHVLSALPATAATRAVLAWRLRVERERDRRMLEE